MASPTAQNSIGPRRPAARPRPVVLYLLALVLVILLPALIVSIVLLQRNNQAQEDVVRSLTDTTVQAIVQSIDREVSGMVTTLRVLSTSQSFTVRNLSQFHERAVLALAGTGSYMIVVDDQNRQLLNTRVPFGEPLGPTGDPDSVRRALESRIPVVSDLFFGQTARQWVFNVLLPITTDEDQPLVLVLTRNAVNLSEALQSRRLPAGWHAALVDAANQVVAATAETGLAPGSILPLRQTGGNEEAEWRRESFDGQPVVTAQSRSILSGWRVVAWATAESVDRPLGESLLWLAAWGVVIAAAAGFVAFALGQRVSQSVRGLRRDATALGRGEAVAARTYPVSEITEVSKALATASEQRQAAEAQVHFLMRELAHRSKNQMTVISAMAKQTARGADDVESYVQNFEKRILGLARSTDLLLAHGRAGVSLADLIAHQIEPFSPPSRDRLEIGGPPIRLNPQSAQLLGMAVHELSTNAVKYGAFSGDRGNLSVVWSLDGDTLVLVWREIVPAMHPENGRKGFGTTVLQSMVGGALGAQVERIAHPDGIEWRFAIPLSSIDPDAAPRSEPDEGE